MQFIALQISEQFCLKARTRQPIRWSEWSDFNAKNGHLTLTSSKVIYFDVIEKPLSDYSIYYCGLVCENSEDT